ncbi:MAG TPA: phosphatase PAP2 family protein [Alphaproteobacteria bacterium]|nr:phosphatase PAP2 family protein [Alphaproteobacteria bacterium]
MIRGNASSAWGPDLLPIGLVLSYGALVQLIAARHGAASQITWTLYLPYALPAMLAVASAGLAILSVQALRRHPELPLVSGLRLELSRLDMDAVALLRSLALLTLLPVFLSLFSSFKVLIPLLHPFEWDSNLAELDRVLHGGVDPWRHLQPLLDQPAAIRLLDFLYHPIWSLTLLALWTWQSMDRRRPDLRLQMLLAVPLVWILVGSIAGTVFSSAGPCYFAEVGGAPDRFGPLLEQLAAIDAEAPLMSQSAQQMLWELHRARSLGLGGGISAMPSVHVASAFLVVLLARRYGRTALVIAFAYFLFMLVGSVALGWHYAVDAYAGIVLSCPVWMGCGAVARRLWNPEHAASASLGLPSFSSSRDIAAEAAETLTSLDQRSHCQTSEVGPAFSSRG